VMGAPPDHTHAVATVAALKSGRHVFCEKPLTHDVYEARVVAQTAAKEKRVTQMGTQIHNHPSGNYRRCVELIQSGAIGAVKEVHVWCGTGYGGGQTAEGRPGRCRGGCMGPWAWAGPRGAPSPAARPPTAATATSRSTGASGGTSAAGP